MTLIALNVIGLSLPVHRLAPNANRSNKCVASELEMYREIPEQ